MIILTRPNGIYSSVSMAVACVTLLVTSAGQVQAGTILSPTSVLANSLGEFSAQFSSTKMIDQSGLSTGFTSGVTDFSAYIATGPTHGTNESNGSWVSPSVPPSGAIDFDLGDSYDIDQVVLWQGVAGNSASVNAFRIFTSSDSAFTSPLLVGSFVAAIGTNLPEVAQVFDTSDSSARYLRLQIDSNYGNSVTGLGEFALDVSAVLEPTILDLDIKPGPSNNTVPLNGNGTLQMAILANEELNVMDVDIGSLLFGDPILVDGGATPLGATSDRLRDLNHDGLDDLLVGFSISDLVDGGALDVSSVEGRLTGELFDGTPIFGSDIVRMVPQNNGGGGLVSSAVPEPTTSALALAALCLAMSRRRCF